MKRINAFISTGNEEKEKECYHAVDDVQEETKKEDVSRHASMLHREIVMLEDDVMLSNEMFCTAHQDDAYQRKK